jgi:hypothetical protein
MRTRHGPLATFRRNLAFRHLSGSEKSDNGAERSTVRNDQKRERGVGDGKKVVPLGAAYYVRHLVKDRTFVTVEMKISVGPGR